MGSAGKTVRLCVGADLAVGTTTTPAFTRAYTWDLTKGVDTALVEQLGGGTATFNYAVAATQRGYADSAWQATGRITVSNPNDWEAITYDLADAVGGNGTCSIDGGGSALSVAASSSKQSKYTCTYSSAPSPASDTNTATASWDKASYATPNGSASGTAGFNFGAVSPTLVDNCVTVTDPNAPSNPLGSACNTDASPKSFPYSKTVNVPRSGCVKYDNTATFTTNTTATTGSASKQVEVCGPANTGALTMGFWQNKNGQGIITGGASTAGVCNSGTWLRQFKPFQDLSATASCSAVATYVYNIVKAANSSGSSMNAMLKAQMLATALDVYFSSAALGGNKIGAPAPIGGVTIDLTKICKMADSSSGGSCTGSFQNVSAAFGGATSMTVMNMLLYQNNVSNAGGSTWYANVKSTQEMAKNAFDAINNQVAFSP
jgi:hypothetical protein